MYLYGELTSGSHDESVGTISLRLWSQLGKLHDPLEHGNKEGYTKRNK